MRLRRFGRRRTRLAGIVEVNETFALKSLKGRLSREQVSVSIAASAKTCLQIAN